MVVLVVVPPWWSVCGIWCTCCTEDRDPPAPVEHTRPSPISLLVSSNHSRGKVVASNTLFALGTVFLVWSSGKVNQVRPIVFKVPVTWTLEKGSVARFHMICLAEFPLTLVTCLFSTGWFLGQVEQYLNRPTNLKLFHWINFNLRANKK